MLVTNNTTHDSKTHMEPDARSNRQAITVASLTAATRMIDPLLEQMASALSLTSDTSGSPVQRKRRFSETDRERSSRSPVVVNTRPDAVSILSRDGARWLPAPDEQSLRSGTKPLNVSSADATSSSYLEPHTCGRVDCAAFRVFVTPELLEIVLNFLDTKSILSLQGTCRIWQSTINASPHLRLHHFIYGQWYRPASEFQLLPLTVIPGLSIERGEAVNLGQWINISMTAEAASRIAPLTWPRRRRVRSRSIFEGLRGGLGPRAKAEAASDAWPTTSTTPSSAVEESPILPLFDLLITQPPLIGVQAHIIYSNTHPNDSPPRVSDDEEDNTNISSKACAKLSCNSGITLGYLAETAQQLLREHDGSSKSYAAGIVFKAIMSFCPPDKTPRKRNSATTTTRIDYDQRPKGEGEIVNVEEISLSTFARTLHQRNDAAMEFDM